MKKEIKTSVCSPHIRQMNAVGVDRLKQAVYAYCCGVKEEENPKYNEDDIIPELLPVWRAFKKNNFDFYKLMVEKDYEQIENEELRIEVLLGTCFPLLNLPIGRYATDWLNGYLDFFKRETEEITDTEVLHQLFFCSSEEDIWKLMAAKGIGDVVSLYHWYKGDDLYPIIGEATGIPCYYEKDEQKASDFLEYLLSDTTVTTARVRNVAIDLKKLVDNNPFKHCKLI